MPEHLIELLDAEYNAILSGRYDDLPGLSDAMEQALAGSEVLWAADAARIRQKATRNNACLAAALSGIKLAQARIREITKAANGLTTYDSKGATFLMTAHSNNGRRA
ncbi:flagellar protein FlgN [Pseudotabrizicola sp. L79]|uniref:flagellar protein FlgN n=1 Tax=Pseudotabrizicola sp. L79 TaxID=3118402 RepID=UPI002F947A6E